MGLKEEFKVQYIAWCSEHSEKKCFYQENNATYLVSTKQADSVDSKLNKSWFHKRGSKLYLGNIYWNSINSFL